MTDWIDRKLLKENTGGDIALAGEVLEIFRGQVDTWGKMLDSGAPCESWADAAHTIKGAALGIGANELAFVCKVAETKGRADPPPSPTVAAVLLNDIRDALFPTMEEAAKISHEISVSGRFRAS